MAKLEVFFDYTCPYCLKGHENLTELLKEFQGLEVEWRPCEAHPRPERYGLHSDLLARAMYFIAEQKADLTRCHEVFYQAAIKRRVNIESARDVAGAAAGLADENALYNALKSGAYADRLRENNNLAWRTLGFPAVPSYRIGNKLLKSVENVGVSREDLRGFIRDNL